MLPRLGLFLPPCRVASALRHTASREPLEDRDAWRVLSLHDEISARSGPAFVGRRTERRLLQAAVDVAREHGIHPTSISRWRREDKSSSATPAPAGPPISTEAESEERLTGRYVPVWLDRTTGPTFVGRLAEIQ